ncbi:MAG: SMP-30/gluconolactonase/LRE family protein [Muriicola sp.]|nr:SMP-30/gluconolactonase/LRE family protein [Muriicola sp.]
MRFSNKPYLTISLLFGLCAVSVHAFQSEDFTPEFSFTKGIEGPAVNSDGTLFAVNFKEEGTIGMVDAEGKGEVFLSLPEGSIGNGIRFNEAGTMFIADYAGHKVYKVLKNSREVHVWAENPEMSQPNDLAIGSNGILYLSDPDWANNSGRIWMVSAKGTIHLLEDAMGTTNGIEVSPDGKVLYVNESAQRQVWKYDIKSDGTITNKSPLISFEDFGLDGMRCDSQGNLYITRYDKGSVVIVSPKGQILKEVFLKGKKPSNIAFGGVDGKTCFVTLADRGCIEIFTAPFSGSYYNKVH